MLRQCFSSGTAVDAHTPYKARPSQNWPKITTYDHVHQIFITSCTWFRRGVLCDRGFNSPWNRPDLLRTIRQSIQIYQGFHSSGSWWKPKRLKGLAMRETTICTHTATQTCYWWKVPLLFSLINMFFFKSDRWGVSVVLFILTFGDRDGLKWPAISGHWLSCTGFCQYLSNMKYLMYALPFLQLSTPLWCFCPWTSFKKRIGLVSMDLLYIIFTYYTQDNQQGCVRLSNWFSL